MHFDEEIIQSMRAIYRFAFENPESHRNVARKKLLIKGKIPSKSKFAQAFDELLSSGQIIMEGENISVNPDVVQTGTLQRDGDDFFIVTPSSPVKYKLKKSIASGYKCGDILNVAIGQVGIHKVPFILGKSEASLQNTPLVSASKGYTPPPAWESPTSLLGRVVKISHDKLVFIPNKKSIPTRQIPILNDETEYASFQDKLCIMELENAEAPLIGGKIVAVKGDAGNPIHEYDAIAESYGAIMSWSGAELEREIARIPSSVDAESLDLISEQDARISQRGKVVDLRHIPFVTVDPATCKDMDDAIFSTFNANGDIVCYTAVANVTKYVSLDSEIGNKYVNGGFTIYAPNKAYNILPSQLSTGVCSLNPNVDRLAFVVKTVIDKDTGAVKSSNIYDAIIRSRQKYSYEQAQETVDIYEKLCPREFLMQKVLTGGELSLDEQLVANYYAGQIIKKGFDQRKMIRFVSNDERDIVFDDGLQDVIDINAIPHLAYHEVIEAFMITANEATAKYARDHSLDNIFRVHDEPNQKKVQRAGEFFNILGINFEGDLSAEGTRTLIELIRGTANEEVINKFLIKMQTRAVYSEHLYGEKKNPEGALSWMGERISHYALQSPHYSHTTSPIRRVPDYITQYNILAHIHGTRPISAKQIESIVETANERQLAVDQAEKDFEDISSVLYCEKHIGEVMSGRITKIRTASVDEGYEDEIIVIVKNSEKGINVEIPLSQILGRPCHDCELSAQRCAVYDGRGNVVLTLCKPIDFIIEKADRKTMIVVGRTNKKLIHSADTKSTRGTQGNQSRYQRTHPSYQHSKEKDARRKRLQGKERASRKMSDLTDDWSK